MVSISAAAEFIHSSHYEILSTDLFDTMLLRDRTLESHRLARAGRRAAATLGLDPDVVVRLRWSFHASAYRAVALERPGGEAALLSITRTMATALGLGEDAAQVLRQAEVDVDAEHLRPNRPLLQLARRVAESRRVIAVSDTYYGEDDLRRLLSRVVGEHPYASVYSSADVGLTKHAGGLFAHVCEQEDMAPGRMLHVGDSLPADVDMARAAGWRAVHLPRSRRHMATKRLGAVQGLPAALQSRR